MLKKLQRALSVKVMALLFAALVIISCQGSTPAPPSRGAKAFPSMSLSTSGGVTSILANGQTTVTIVAKVYKDINVLADNGTEITFTTTRGTFANGTATINATISNGMATAVLKSSTAAGRAYIRAQGTALAIAASYSVDFVAGPLAGISLEAPVAELNADGASTTAITAEAVDAYGNLVETTLEITFTTNLGTFVTTTGTTSKKLYKNKGNAASTVQTITVSTDTGIASVTLKAPSTTGTATIVASSGALNSNAVSIEFIPYEVSYILYLQADKTNMQASNDTAVISITLADKNNVAIPSAQVSVATTLGVVNVPAVTDANGQTTTNLMSMGIAGTAIVTVSYGNVSRTINIYIASAPPGGVAVINLSAVPTTVTADGTSTSTIRAQVFSDMNGNAVDDGTPVAFSITYGPTDPGTITPRATTTCESGSYTNCGVATATYTSGTQTGLVTISATAGSVTKEISVELLPAAGTLLYFKTPVPTSITANGASTSLITAVVLDDNSNRVSGASVTFTTTLGTISPTTVVTDNTGEATTTLTSSMTPGIADISATAVGSAASTTVVFTNSNLSITLQANPSTVSANGTSTSSITALLRDGNNNPVPNQNIEFTTDVGTVSSSAKTNASGIATATFTSVRRNDTATITATYGLVTSTINVNITGISLAIEANPTSVLSNGGDTDNGISTITVTLKDASGTPIQSEAITLSGAGVTFRNGATIVTGGTTDINGQLTISASSDTAGAVAITAAGAGASSSVTVTFTDYNFYMTITDNSINTCGVVAPESTVVTVTLENSVGTGIAGVPVDLYTTLGSINGGACDDTPKSILGTVTNGAGDAVFTLWGGTITGTAQLTARASYNPGSGVIDLVATDTVSIGAVTPAALTLTASPNRVAYNGSTSTITAMVTDVDGNPVANEVVSFDITNGPGAGESLTPATVVTDSNGRATTTFRTGSLPSFYEGVTIQAEVSGGSISATVELTITGPPAHVAVGYELSLVDDADGTFKQWIATSVTDVYGNAVADGTLVTLGVRGIGFYAQDGVTFFLAEDTNLNGILDCPDVDSNCDADCADVGDTDIDGDNLCDCEDGSTGYPKNDVLDPQSSAVIPSSQTTVSGVARVLLVYAQSDACWIRIRIDAESGGVSDPDGVQYTLPTTETKGCPEPKYRTNIIAPGTSIFDLYNVDVIDGASIVLSISDFNPLLDYTWTVGGTAAGSLTPDNTGTPQDEVGTGLNAVTYTAPAAGTGTDTVTVEDCSNNSRYININYAP